MKLISNSPYGTVFRYFRGTDNSRGWSVSSPAVYHRVASSDGVIDMQGFSKTDDAPKCLLFLAEAGVDYAISSSVPIGVLLYDFLRCDDEDVSDGVGWICRGDGVFRFSVPKFILARISPTGEDSVSERISIWFSNTPPVFDYSSRWVRDWPNAIDGRCWNRCGKVHYMDRLSIVGRRAMPGKSAVPVLSFGMMACAVGHSGEIGSLEAFETLFLNGPEMRPVSGMSFSDVCAMFGTEPSSSVVKFRCLWMSEFSHELGLTLSGDGEYGLVSNRSRLYGTLPSNVVISLSEGLNDVTLYCRLPMSASPLPVSYVGNESDADEIIEYAELFSGASIHAMYDGYESLDGESSFMVMCSNARFRSVAFWVRYDMEYTHQYSILHGEHFSVERTGESAVTLLFSFHSPVVLSVPFGEWHHLCVVMSDGVIAWYLDAVGMGYSLIDGIPPIDDRYEAGKRTDVENSPSGAFDIYSLVVSMTAFRQNEVVRIMNFRNNHGEQDG